MEKNNRMRYSVSNTAKKDLENIFEFTHTEFGIIQAYNYLNKFELTFQKLSITPLLGRKRIEISPNMHSYKHQSHVIFFTTHSNSIKIVRVFHLKQNYVAYFESKFRK